MIDHIIRIEAHDSSKVVEAFSLSPRRSINHSLNSSLSDGIQHEE